MQRAQPISSAASNLLAAFAVFAMFAVFAVSAGCGEDTKLQGDVDDVESTADACDNTTVPLPAECPNDLFTPDRPTESWRRLSTRLFVVTQGGPHHRCIDMIFNPGQEQQLIGKFTYGPFDKDLKGEDVEIWLRVACGSWVKLGRSTTSNDGQYGTVAGVGDDGGRVFFTVPAAARPGVGDYEVKMLVKGDHTEARCSLSVWPQDTHAIVSDIDGTITTHEVDGFTSFFDPAAPDAHRWAPETFAAWASKGWRVIYLTARPEILTPGTRDWFATHDFPRGVFHLSQSNFGESGNSAINYKASYLEALVRDRGLVLDAAYGNKDTDRAAYLRAGVPLDETRLFGFDGDLMGAVRFDDYGPEADRVSCLTPVAQP